MDVVEWTPGLKNHSYLYVFARLTCPFCRTEAEVETIAQLFHGLPTADGGRVGGPSFSIENVLSDLAKQRACEHCGIVSIVPKMDRDRLFAEAHHMLTTEWVEAEAARIREAEAACA